jgi:hypothetical protein
MVVSKSRAVAWNGILKIASFLFVAISQNHSNSGKRKTPHRPPGNAVNEYGVWYTDIVFFRMRNLYRCSNESQAYIPLSRNIF